MKNSANPSDQSIRARAAIAKTPPMGPATWAAPPINSTGTLLVVTVLLPDLGVVVEEPVVSGATGTVNGGTIGVVVMLVDPALQAAGES